ncbi:hypothetical protein THAOC_23592 [Thalassiosira oceanica]|uniref:Uncharacterized protein n=1 Tax=Thalassiosira oceanica TaxID=159749 RepID=K0RRQ1_THAOC|nr:hypothetical protein THAOC_23592 [Thalassiosira oceanica]|mmetsp:Transcript_38984/g.93373  ORF Transcript_38984/g.93373 Transcript_38984/m.93373 type:complete len:618 (+) Transcript_38984:383-2236(+)|eukprot:EJK56508.1 hypothetical protein THAOC_23592 [Thalassiosira oceanica]
MKLIALYAEDLIENAVELFETLQFPERQEYISAWRVAVKDVAAAARSSYSLGYLTFRPILILLGILGQYLAIILKFVAKHSVEKGWIAAKEGYSQIRTATIWFVNYQRSLSTSAKYAELGLLSALVMLWLLRRHVRKKRYVERVQRWYAHKKRRTLRRYHNFVERVAKTSSFLAALLPHVFYSLLMIAAKRFLPWLITYLATRTYLTSAMSFWFPLYQTCSLIAQLKPHIVAYKEEERLKDEARKDTRSKSALPSMRKKREREQVEMESLRRGAVDLLKYWTVYAILLAIVGTAKMLPVVGRVLDATKVDPAKAGKNKWFSLPRISTGFVQEMCLIFYTWLRLMPTSITDDELANVEVALSITKPADARKTARSNTLKRPIDIMFNWLSPMALMAMNSTAFLKSASNDDSKASTFFADVLKKFSTLLELLVWSRLMSSSFKEWLVTTIIESSALAPAFTTLLMPSYFTSFGVIYVSLVVPAGYSADSTRSILFPTSKLGVITPKVDEASRYLKFWVVHAVLSLLLRAFAPLLAWIPLSTHAVWLLWAYVQLKSTTLGIFTFLESELSHSRIEDTVVARSTKRLLSALPSGVADTTTAASQPEENVGADRLSESKKDR